MAKSIAHILTKEALTETYIDQHMPLEEVAKYYHTSVRTVRNYMKKHSISSRPFNESNRRYRFIDSSGFLNPVDDWHAYWIGFIAADANITDKGVFRLTVGITDQSLLEDFVSGTNAENPIYQFQPNMGGKAVRMQMRDDNLISALDKWGITPRKSLTIQWPCDFPEHLYPAFIRGYFDGNGTIYQRHRQAKEYYQVHTETACRFICGSPPFLDGLEQALRGYGVNMVKRYQNQGTQAYVLPLSGSKVNLIKFADLIYQDCSTCLERKREVFNSLR